MSLERIIFSLQSKLIAAFVLIVVAALVLAGSIFVALRRSDQEEQALFPMRDCTRPVLPVVPGG